MKHKSLGTCILLLGLLLVPVSSAYADTIAITTISLSNLQLTPTSGSIVFLGPEFGSRTNASSAASNTATNGFFEESSNFSQSPTHAEAITTLTFASAGGVSDFPNSFFSAATNVMLSGCTCTAETEGLASLNESFMIVGGSGSVNVTLSALFQSIQTLATDELSLFAATQADLVVQIGGADTFFFHFGFTIPTGSINSDIQNQISQAVTLQFDQQYTLGVFIRANSRAAQNEIPEPATVVLLVSGLGFMTGFVRKHRTIRVSLLNKGGNS